MSATAGGRGRPEQRAAFLAGAVEHVLHEGVADLSLRPLAAALGTSDRMLLYYFGTREQLLVAVLGEVGGRLQEALETALPSGSVPPAELLTALWSALGTPSGEPHLRLYVEVSGLAARGREPFATVARQVAEGWLAWLAARLAVSGDRRRDAAAGVLAALDGALLLRFVASPEVADTSVDWVAARLRSD